MSKDNRTRPPAPVAGLLYGAMLALSVGFIVLRWRPARLRSSRVTAVAPGSPPIASVALTYGPGAPPVSVILDLRGKGGAGSATIDGRQLFVEVPIAGALDEAYDVTATAAYRVLGRVWTSARTFSGQR